MADALKKALPPYFISAMAFNIARHWDNLSEAEELILKRLQRTFKNDILDRETMLELANLDVVRDRLNSVKQKKWNILQGRLDKLHGRFAPAFREELRQIRSRLATEKEAFESGSVVELSKKLKESAARLKKGKNSVTHVFEIHVNSLKKNMAEIEHAIKRAAADAKKFRTREGNETKEEPYVVSTSKWWNPLSWGSTETCYRTISVNYSYANVHDAIDKVEGFILDAEKILINHIREAINVDGLRRDILQAVKKLVDFEDDSFDPDDILRPVEIAVSRLTVPEVNLNLSTCIDGINRSFNKPEVRNNDIDRLRQSVGEATNKALEEINSAVTASRDRICQDLTKTGELFIANITNDLVDQIKRLKNSQNDLNGTLMRYNQVLSLLDETKITHEEKPFRDYSPYSSPQPC